MRVKGQREKGIFGPEAPESIVFMLWGCRGDRGGWQGRMCVWGLLQALGCDDGSREDSPGFDRPLQAAGEVGLGRALFMQQICRNTYKYQVLS